MEALQVSQKYGTFYRSIAHFIEVCHIGKEVLHLFHGSIAHWYRSIACFIEVWRIVQGHYIYVSYKYGALVQKYCTSFGSMPRCIEVLHVSKKYGTFVVQKSYMSYESIARSLYISVARRIEESHFSQVPQSFSCWNSVSLSLQLDEKRS